MDKFNPLYPSIPLSTRRNQSKSPKERPICPQPSTSAVPEEELAPYKDNDPLTANFMMPEDHEVPQESSVSNEPTTFPTSQDLSKPWEAPGTKEDRFPVELSPFVDLNS
jgi:hypothetical protein